jgi:hypothetical protein
VIGASAFFVAIAAGAPALARAATPCPSPPGMAPSLAAVDGETRLGWIDGHLSATARTARLWTWGWGIGIGGATVANLAPLPFVPKEDRVDWYTAAATTVVGIVPLLIAPLDVIGDAQTLRARIDAAAAEPGTDVCKLLAEAETLLVRDAQNQRDGQRWWLHVGSFALNAGVGLFLGLGFHHWGAGAFNFATGAVIGELIILSQPTGTIGDLEHYRANLVWSPPLKVP